MGLEKIKEEILSKAAALEKDILADAEAKANEIKIKAAGKISQLEKEAAQKLESESKSLESREISLANMEAQKMLFEAKRELTDNAYEEAFSKIRNMPPKEREHTIKKLLEIAKKEIDVGTIYSNKNDKTYCGDRSKEIQVDGGIICETKDGNVRVNLTFNALFADLREKTSKEVSKILFS